MNYFDYVLPLLTHSQAYGMYCERVYGKNLAQFNRASMDQIDELVRSIGNMSGKRALDVGCGNGVLTEYLTLETEGDFLAIDSSEKAIAAAQKRKSSVQFQVRDFRDIEETEGRFHAILSVDTIGSQPDLPTIIACFSNLLEPEGKLFFLHGENLNDDKSEALKTSLLYNELRNVGFDVEAKDFSDSERRLWKKSETVLKDLTDLFREEGNVELFEDLVDDTTSFLKIV